jgi:DNA adenine methylase
MTMSEAATLQFQFSFKAEPILKWAGGKQIIARRLAEFFPKTFRRYYDPFVGGCSVALESGSGEGQLNDQNAWLIDTYRAIRDDWRRVAQILDTMKNTEEEFYRIREINPQREDEFTRAALLIYLNKTCFRGLFRVNKLNRFNVPYGKYDRRYYDPANLAAFAEFIGNYELRVGDFELALADAGPEDFVYLDPPYHRIGGYSDFNRYTSGQFKEIDHLRLRNVCAELDKRGIRWVQSNSSTKYIRELYRDFYVSEILNRREINLNSKSRDIKELVIKNF